jgi:hypothetical protein
MRSLFWQLAFLPSFDFLQAFASDYRIDAEAIGRQPDGACRWIDGDRSKNGNTGLTIAKIRINRLSIEFFNNM